MGLFSSKGSQEKHDENCIEYLKCGELRKWLVAEFGNQSKGQFPSSDQYQIVDVRNSDFSQYGYKIRNAINHPANSDVSELVEHLKHKEIVIFHCMYSEIRGPSMARNYIDYREADAIDFESQRVMVLEGGFNGFWTKFHSDSHKDIVFEAIP